jgi:hypothetical protein
LLLQSLSEAIDEHAGSPQASQFHDRDWSQPDTRAERQPFEGQPCRGDVLAEISRVDVVTGPSKRFEQFDRDQMDLSEIGKSRLPTGEVAMPNERACMGVTLDAMAFDLRCRGVLLKWCPLSAATATTFPCSERSSIGVLKPRGPTIAASDAGIA